VTTRDYFQNVIRSHPVPPVARDPLAAAADAQQAHYPRPTGRRPRIGFACHWEGDPKRTWSGSAWNLHAALQLKSELTDIGVKVPTYARTALKALYTRYYGGRATTTWIYSPLTDWYTGRTLRRELTRGAGQDCDAVVMIDDLAALPVPFVTYYDSSWDLLISAVESAEAFASLRAITPSILARRRDRQIAVYEQAAAVIAFSRWQAQSLVVQSGVPPAKVHVALPAITGHLESGSASGRTERKLLHPVPRRERPRRRLLFVGRQHQWYDFYRKGGDLVVAALGILRREYDPQITLTIAGVEKWPLPGSAPDGVSLPGVLPRDEIRTLYDSHDLFVMPARLEPFGLVFAEAIARGLPCVARNACAMPEIVTPGLSGVLVGSDDEHELAGAIAAALSDDQLYENCASRAEAFAAFFSWERTADDVMRAIAQSLDSPA
jgi:glycosyltransferase involved in cell wall biosynthesis